MNDLPVGRSVDETLRLVQAFQYTDKHGEGTKSSFKLQYLKTNKWFSVDSLSCLSCTVWNYVFFFCTVCPAGWKPGSDTVSITGATTDLDPWSLVL